MGEFKFRGKQYDKKQWIYGNLLEETELVADGVISADEVYIGFENEWNSAIKETVGRYTGLKDRNGVKIFEGDIVEREMFGETKRGEITWSDIGKAGYYFKVKKQERAIFYPIERELCDVVDVKCNDIVIGNIHDNPELLEGVEWMSDLTRKSELIKLLNTKHTIAQHMDCMDIFDAINSCEIAYNVDKVVEELESASYEPYDALEFADQRQLDLSDAIEIVRRVERMSDVLQRAIKRIENGIILAQHNIDKSYRVQENELAIEELKCCKEALEKQEAKSIDKVGNKCPICACYVASQPIGDHYCFNCGKALDWRKNE